MPCWLAPAKINLSLKVVGKRSDGFHDLESVMLPVSVFDSLEIEHKPDGDLEFSCSDPTVPSDESNLVVRAARLFCSSFGFLPRLRIHLTKEIPHGAGLGGGSSDAATTLLALNALFATELKRDALASLGAELGSDIPFFIYQSGAQIRGRGEIVEPQKGLPELALLLIKPPFGVPTPWAFKNWKDSLEIPGVSYGEQTFPWGTLVNDLERPVFEKFLLLAELKTWLLEQPEVLGALMSGSGSTVFAVLREKELGYVLGEKIAKEFGLDFWVYLCETIP
jgi:4-diphosphocytidyl-2-C-methyl-D-erythritol kinase